MRPRSDAWNVQCSASVPELDVIAPGAVSYGDLHRAPFSAFGNCVGAVHCL